MSVLAEAARTTRTTIYADLRSQGIDPDDRPKEDPVIPMIPITMEGMNGLDDETDALVIEAAEDRYFSEHHTSAGVSESVAHLYELRLVVGVYNRLRPLLAAEQTARRDRDRALHLVEVRWEALSTATAWKAAHHAYVVAVDAAHTAIDTWAAAARAAVDFGWFPVRRAEQVYEQEILGAGFPPLEQLTLDVDSEAKQLHERLTRTHEHRIGLADQTLHAEPATR
ncbi:hypothetical protein [Streptomyces sp. NPDC048623]|uniref:hypothetical protein n=1 Tax=Streptomyces sp. NPDC048623 TaxID=3155761 RepID=UPI003420AECE